ncbi:MAG: twin-arginine translocation signal domain-containing protein [Byssovorax sp.]
MALDLLKNLEGSSRRNFLRFTAAAGAVLALDRSKVLDVIADTGGTAMADEASCSANCRSVHIVAGDGGFAWFQLLWPHVEIATSGNDNFAFHAKGQQVKADTDKAFYYAPESPFQKLDKGKQISAFMAGTNQTHTPTPGSAATLGAGQSMLATVAAIQRATPSLLPVIGIDPVDFGNAPGAPDIAKVGNADGLVQLFNSAASQAILAAPKDAALFEAYYKAFLGMNKAASRPTWSRQLRTGKASANFLGKNLAAQLAPNDDDLARYGINDGTPTKLSEIGRALITAAKAFRLGLTQSLILPAMRDDPHGAFQDMNALRKTVGSLGKFLDEFMGDLGDQQDPVCTSRSLADNVVITVHGDTPKDPRNMNGWPDGTPGNANWLYVMGNGHLKTGWFGGVKADGNVSGFDPSSGNEVPGKPASDTSAAAGAAVAFAVAKRDMKRVRDFYTGPSIDGIVNTTPL